VSETKKGKKATDDTNWGKKKEQTTITTKSDDTHERPHLIESYLIDILMDASENRAVFLSGAHCSSQRILAPAL